MPSTLMELLVDDYDMVTRQLHLAKLPARFTVDDIVNEVALFLFYMPTQFLTRFSIKMF